MYINTFKYKPEDVSCVLCTEYVKKLGCTALSCPCLAERMEAGTVGYAEAVAELFPYRPRLTARIMRLAESFPRNHVAGQRPQEAYGEPCGCCWAAARSATRQSSSPRCIC